MHSTLCRERLHRILGVLNRLGGSATVRDLQRTFSIWGWEIEQACDLGWVTIEDRRNRRGPRSQLVSIVSNPVAANEAPLRRELYPPIKWHHRLFAENTLETLPACRFPGFRMATAAEAYRMTYRTCRSAGAARVGACRLMKRLDVGLMRRWLFCEINREVTGPMPWTVEGLIAALDAIGRIRWVMRNPRKDLSRHGR